MTDREIRPLEERGALWADLPGKDEHSGPTKGVRSVRHDPSGATAATPAEGTLRRPEMLLNALAAPDIAMI